MSTFPFEGQPLQGMQPGSNLSSNLWDQAVGTPAIAIKGHELQKSHLSNADPFAAAGAMVLPCYSYQSNMQDSQFSVSSTWDEVALKLIVSFLHKEFILGLEVPKFCGQPWATPL